VCCHCRSIITILTAVTGLFSTGLNYGGAVAISFGWPLVSMMSFIVALSMAEICSGARLPIYGKCQNLGVRRGVDLSPSFDRLGSVLQEDAQRQQHDVLLTARDALRTPLHSQSVCVWCVLNDGLGDGLLACDEAHSTNTFVWLVTCCAHVHVLREGGFGNACLTLDGLAEGFAKQLCMLQNMIDMFAELVLLHRKH